MRTKVRLRDVWRDGHPDHDAWIWEFYPDSPPRWYARLVRVAFRLRLWGQVWRATVMRSQRYDIDGEHVRALTFKAALLAVIPPHLDCEWRDPHQRNSGATITFGGQPNHSGGYSGDDYGWWRNLHIPRGFRIGRLCVEVES